MAGLIPGKQTTRFGALWDGDDGGAAGGDAATAAASMDPSMGFGVPGVDPGLGDVDPGLGAGDLGITTQDIAAVASPAQSLGMSFQTPEFDPRARGPGIGTMQQAKASLDNISVAEQNRQDAVLGALLGVLTLGIPGLSPTGPTSPESLASRAGLDVTEEADEAVAAQEQALGQGVGIGGDVGAFPFIQPPPSIATPQAAQTALTPIAPFVPAIQGPRDFRSPASPALDPALLAAFQQRLARISGV